MHFLKHVSVREWMAKLHFESAIAPWNVVMDNGEEGEKREWMDMGTEKEKIREGLSHKTVSSPSDSHS